MSTVEKVYLKNNNTWSQYNEIYLTISELEDNKKGVSFISYEGHKRLSTDSVKGFCHTRFKANFIISNIDVNQLAVDQLLQIGDAVIKITQVEKDCLPKCPIIVRSNVSCNVNKQAFFGKVIKEGLVKENDDISFI